MFSFILNTAKYSFHENKQIESSRSKGVSCSVLVVEYGHLAVTKDENKRRMVTRLFHI
ncbi:hypothetical protein [Barnesiella intestinihominis]|uniref:hypothetical protein n=1 Tax=Barnesiella intestinihominis TaxID=487174 RepID=UPI002672AAC1|nr:hypothetical protein [Barnesiella intestinihominis]